LSKADAAQRAEQLLAEFDLAAQADARAGTYSGGMRRRLDLAASLVVIPSVLFLDEPTTGLDTRSRQTLWRRIEELAAAGTTIFLTTQYLEEADELADRIGVLDGGRLVAEGTAAELKARVGADVLELTVACPAARARAAALLDATSGDDDSLHVPTDGSAGHVRAVLDALAANHIDDVRVAVRAPTLDDVFLALTEVPAA
jgi:ABC-2 type transport system ATP-binding protein